MADPTFTHAELKRAMRYDPDTGIFTRLRNGEVHPTLGHRDAGCVWFYKPGRAYRRITLLGGEVLGHRLAWFYMTGEWPAALVDHRNLDGLDNRWENLREATKAQNATNSALRADSTSGLKGASFEKRRGKWFAQIKIDGQRQWLGYHPTASAAHEAYCAAAKAHHGDFGRSA